MHLHVGSNLAWHVREGSTAALDSNRIAPIVAQSAQRAGYTTVLMGQFGPSH